MSGSLCLVAEVQLDRGLQELRGMPYRSQGNSIPGGGDSRAKAGAGGRGGWRALSWGKVVRPKAERC